MKLMKFSTPNCGACKMLQHSLDQAGNLPEIEYVNCEESPELAGEFEVFQVPTLILLDNDNKEIKRHTGFMSKTQLEGWVTV